MLTAICWLSKSGTATMKPGPNFEPYAGFLSDASVKVVVEVIKDVHDHDDDDDDDDDD